MTSIFTEFADEAEKIRSFQEQIREVSEIVETPEKLEEMNIEKREKLQDEKQEKLKKKKAFFYNESKKESVDIQYKENMEHLFKVTNSFGPHLLTYLTVPGLPATNNTTEQFFGSVRTKLRRITGRQNNHSLILNRGDYIALTLNVGTYEDILKRISGVSYTDFVNEKKACEQQNKNQKIQFKVRKDPKGFSDMLNFLWKNIAEIAVSSE